MCGIAGILNLNDTFVRSESLKDMIRMIRHRGPDASGIYIGGPIGLAHARLSIIDLSGGHRNKEGDKSGYDYSSQQMVRPGGFYPDRK